MSDSKPVSLHASLRSFSQPASIQLRFPTSRLLVSLLVSSTRSPAFSLHLGMLTISQFLHPTLLPCQFPSWLASSLPTSWLASYRLESLSRLATGLLASCWLLLLSRLAIDLLASSQLPFLSRLATGLLTSCQLHPLGSRANSCPWFSAVSVMQLSPVPVWQQPVEPELPQSPVPVLQQPAVPQLQQPPNS